MTELHFKHWPPGVPRGLDYPQTSIVYNLEVSATRFPDKACMIFYGHVLSYREVWHAVRQLARYLRDECDIQMGDRVLLDVQNAPQFGIAWFAILLARGMVVPINPMSKTEELAYYLEDSGCKAAIIAQDVAPQLLPLIGHAQLKKIIVAPYADYLDRGAGFVLPAFINANTDLELGNHCIWWRDALAKGDSLMANRHAGHPAASTALFNQALRTEDIGMDDACVLPYTSGSTGKPKGCIHTHRTMMASTFMGLWWKVQPSSAVVLATAPFFHVTGMVNSLNTPVLAGATIVMLPRWDAAVAAQLIEKYRCTAWTNVPPMVVDILSNPQAAQYDLSSLNSISGGGAAMPGPIAQKLKDQYGLEYIEGYGMTEFMAATHLNPVQNPKKQCLGIPVFDSDAYVINPDTFEVLGPHQQGEIVMSGPNMMRGYWNQEGDPYVGNLITIKGREYFRSGDLGYQDEDGYFFISDRLKRMINASGFKVWPAEVEGMFYQHPAIKECCIIAAPDPKRGETVKLCVVLKPGFEDTTPETLMAWAREKMSAYKVPTQVEFLAALPRTPSGKLFWRQLQDQAFGRQTQ